jgi:hypothetical protein
MNTTTSEQGKPKYTVLNKNLIPCQGYMRGVLIDVTNATYRFMLNTDLEQMEHYPERINRLKEIWH